MCVGTVGFNRSPRASKPEGETMRTCECDEVKQQMEDDKLQISFKGAAGLDRSLTLFT